MPVGQLKAARARLPAMQPVQGPWLFCDAAYTEQMAERRRLLRHRESDVYQQTQSGRAAARGFLAMALDALPPEFSLTGGHVTCPDGYTVSLDWDDPLWSVGHMLQQDVCILEQHEGVHVLSGAVLCFPASWTLAQKIGKPLIDIHQPVEDYDSEIAKRVQRLFDGVKEGRPLWRANAMRYEDPALFQPRLENDPRPIGSATASFVRSERQTVLRLPQPNAVAFMIHTTVVRD